MTYQDYVKELVLGLTQAGTGNRSRGVTLMMNLLDLEDGMEVEKKVRSFLPEDYVDQTIVPSRRPYLRHHSVYDMIVSLEEDGHDVIRFVIEAFKTKSLVVKELPAFESNLREISQFFDLDEVASRCLAYMFIHSHEEQFSDFCNEHRWREELLKHYEFISPDRGKVMDALGLKGALVTLGIGTIRVGTFRMNPVIAEFLQGSAETSFEDSIVSPPPKDILPMSFFDLSEDKMTYLRKLLEKSRTLNILFTGIPGTGKTSLAYSLTKDLGIECLSLKHDLEKTENRKSSLFAARRLAQKTGKVLIVDEADDLVEHNEGLFFRSNDSSKASINLFLDGCEDVRIIWITNKNRIDPSTARRFNYVLNFGELTQTQRQKIWMNTAEKTGQTWVLEAPEFPRLVQRYQLDAGSISDGLTRAREIGEENIPFLTHYLDQKKEFLKGRGQKDLPACQTYSVDALNMSTSPESVIEMLRKFRARKEPDHSFNLLFHGVSGSGKTEFVRYIGEALETPVIMKSVSDLVSKYVGETEARIAESFKEARVSKSILFYDEADSFFQNRENADRQYERNQVNELLIQLSNFHGGTFIASTNFMSFDPAAMRRFQLKVKFDYLNEAGKRLLFHRFFPQFDFPEVLLQISSVTPGDFKNVAQRLSYEDSYDVPAILREFREEVSYKSINPKVGLI